MEALLAFETFLVLQKKTNIFFPETFVQIVISATKTHSLLDITP